MTIDEVFQNAQSLGKTGLAAALFTLVVQIVWTSGRWAADVFRLKVWLRPRKHRLELEYEDSDLHRKVDFYVLLVRYGADHYLKSVASESEKRDGRQRLTIHKCKVEPLNNGIMLYVPIRVHPTLGTQFKVFAEPKEGQTATYVKGVLERCQSKNVISDVTISDSMNKERIYFLINRIAMVPSVQVTMNGTTVVEKTVVNNYIFPV